MKTKKYVYLAGPIRVTDQETYLDYDINWRNELINHYHEQRSDVRFYNPVNINLAEYCKRNKLDYLDRKTLNYAFTNDMRMILSSDMCIANIIPFSKDNYPCFGTISEIGMFVEKKKEVIIICEQSIKDKLATNPMYITCTLCASLEEAIDELDKKLGYVVNDKKEDCSEVFDSLINFEDPFLQNKHVVDPFDDDMIIIHNVKLRMQTVYKALYRRKI